MQFATGDKITHYTSSKWRWSYLYAKSNIAVKTRKFYLKTLKMGVFYFCNKVCHTRDT